MKNGGEPVGENLVLGRVHDSNSSLEGLGYVAEVLPSADNVALLDVSELDALNVELGDNLGWLTLMFSPASARATSLSSLSKIFVIVNGFL